MNDTQSELKHDRYTVCYLIRLHTQRAQVHRRSLSAARDTHRSGRAQLEVNESDLGGVALL